MSLSVQALAAMACLFVLVLIAVVVLRRREENRARGIKQWVREFLLQRDGQLADDLHIACTADRLWPILVSFRDRPAGARRRLLFSCGGPRSTYRLLCETVEEGSGRTSAPSAHGEARPGHTQERGNAYAAGS